jgi:hypothetical protein
LVARPLERAPAGLQAPSTVPLRHECDAASLGPSVIGLRLRCPTSHPASAIGISSITRRVTTVSPLNFWAKRTIGLEILPKEPDTRS